MITKIFRCEYPIKKSSHHWPTGNKNELLMQFIFVLAELKALLKSHSTTKKK